MKKTALAILLAAGLFLLAGCGSTGDQTAVSDSLTGTEIAEKLQASGAFTELTPASDKVFEKYLMIETEGLEDHLLLTDATRETAEMIILVKVGKAEETDAVRRKLDDYLAEQKALYRDYQPGEMSKLDQAAAEIRGRWIILLVSKDTSASRRLLQEIMK